MTVPIEHPAWCDREHHPDYAAHTADIGGQEVEVGGSDLSVSLYQQGPGPVEVWLLEHRRDSTAVTPLTPEQARTLGQWLLSAADTIGGGVRYPLTDEHTNSGPGGAI